MKKISVKDLKFGHFYVRVAKDKVGFLTLYLGYYRKASLKVYVFYDVSGLLIKGIKDLKIADIQDMDLQKQIDCAFQHQCDSYFLTEYSNGLYSSIYEIENRYNSKGYESWYLKSRLIDTKLPDLVFTENDIDTNLVTKPSKNTIYAIREGVLAYYYGYNKEQKVHKFVKFDFISSQKYRYRNPEIFCVSFKTYKKLPKLYTLQTMLENGVYTAYDVEYIRKSVFLKESLIRMEKEKDISVDD